MAPANGNECEAARRGPAAPRRAVAWEIAGLAFLLLLSVFFRAHLNNSGIAGQVSMRHDEVHYVSHVIHFLNGDWEVTYFVNPSFYMYVLYGATMLVGACLAASGASASFPDFVADATMNPFLVTMTGRGMALLFGACAVLLLYWIARRLFSAPVAFVAALALAVNWTHVERCALAGNEAMTVLLLLVWFLALLRFMERPGSGRHALAGLLLGLAVSAKYNAGGFLVTMAGATVIRALQDGRPGARFSALLRPRHWLGFLLVPVGFVLGSPAAVPRFALVVKQFTSQAQSLLSHGWVPQEAAASASAWDYYLREFATLNNGLPFALLCAAGGAALLYLAVRRGHVGAQMLLLAAVPTLLFFGSGIVARMRFLLPVIPFLLVFGAFCLDAVIGVLLRAWRRGRSFRAGVVIASALLLLAPHAVATYQNFWERYGRTDSCCDVKNWMDEHLDAQQTYVTLDCLGTWFFDQWALASRYGLEAPGVLRTVRLDSLLDQADSAEALLELLRARGLRHLLLLMPTDQLRLIKQIPDTLTIPSVQRCRYWATLVDRLAEVEARRAVVSGDGLVTLVHLELAR
ncbi:MAG: glycosyltransferase family 39 protein [Planctomycetes bacterium]|nr:glycosyltransferase family 39 protein [Planctomycetota bacterium]